MKLKLFFLLLFAIICSFSNAQQEYDDAPWCPKGAVWTYYYLSGMDMDTDEHFLQYIYEKDTIIHEIEVKTIGVYSLLWAHNYNIDNLIWTRHIQKIADEYLFERNDTIFRYDGSDDSFIFLYSWNLNIGDTFIAKSLNTTYSKGFWGDSIAALDEIFPPEAFFVSNISYQKFVGEKLFKRFDIQPINRDTSEPYPVYLNFGPIISKIGSLLHFFPYPNGDPNYQWWCYTREYERISYVEIRGLYCYSDSIRGYPTIINDYVPYGFDREKPYCLNSSDTIPVGNEDKKSGNASIYKLHPNPVFDEVFITSEENTVIKKTTILNIKGEKVLTVFDNKRRISVNALPVGVYMIRITDSEGRWETLKFIKTK